MGDEEAATLDGQFYEFAKYMDLEKKRDGSTITLYRSDFWFRQSKLIDDRKLTMTDTGLVWFKWCKTELDWDEWCQFLQDLCVEKELDYEFVEMSLTNCGLPGTLTVLVPQYRDYFDNYKPKSLLMF
ncbi:tubulin polymerization-promoting protein homolog [Pectinophora gossypiella]|uniref:tubulin polymerization-promoting protein homolog n=1 Tax=Pectinophora gossypiella TaxID=13191 RepID=UPI00214EC6A0|nr:tubulin polymerization-promoting protein homolog [Pectinophora gossypiella]